MSKSARKRPPAKRWREAFDVASARAVAALPVLLEYCLPLVKKGGLFIAMKGAGAAQEAQQAQAAAAKLGGRYGRQAGFYIARRAVPAACCFMRKYRKLRRFTQKRRQNCKSAAEVTALLSRIVNGNNWKLKRPRGMLSFEEGPRGFCVPPPRYAGLLCLHAIGAVKKEEHI